MGSVDRELATDSPASVQFFASLRQALQTNYFAEKGPSPRQSQPRRLRGFVYPLPRSTLPIGFVLLKAFAATSFEVWLLGIGVAYRRHGQAGAMIDELLASPAGRCAHLVRCPRDDAGAAIVAEIFRRRGFVQGRSNEDEVWLLHPAAPRELVQAIVAAPSGDAAYS